MEDPAVSPPLMTVMAQIGCRPNLEDRTRGQVDVTPFVSSHGVVRLSTLMLLADIVVGMRLEELIDDMSFTTDFSIRMERLPTAGTIHAAATTLRHGKRLMVDEVVFTDQTGDAVAYCQITFIRVPPLPDMPDMDIQAARNALGGADRPPMSEPFEDLAGLQVIDAAKGEVQLEPAERVRRPGGFVQGSIMTLMGELAGQRFAEHHLGVDCLVVDMDSRYLIGGRTGPLVTSAAWMGKPSDGRVRVELRDQGHKNAVATTFFLRVQPV